MTKLTPETIAALEAAAKALQNDPAYAGFIDPKSPEWAYVQALHAIDKIFDLVAAQAITIPGK